jgi:hypothetical protein
MENKRNIIIEKAVKFCEDNVHDWFNIPEATQQWYVIQVSQLLLENGEVKKILFLSQLN